MLYAFVKILALILINIVGRFNKYHGVKGCNSGGRDKGACIFIMPSDGEIRPAAQLTMNFCLDGLLLFFFFFILSTAGGKFILVLLNFVRGTQ
jgi:hypothetical protein